VFDYFYDNQQEQYLFLQLPLMLIKDDMFKKLSDSAKILYSLLLNRTSLSIKNNWKDEHGRVYIIFTLDDIMEDLNCAREKANKSMKELKDIKLIESVRRGLGLPNLIYVKNFSTALKYTKNAVNTQKFENRTSRSSDIELQDSREIELQEVRKSNSINIDFKDIDSSDTESSQSQHQTETKKISSKEKPDMTMTSDMTPNDNVSDYRAYETIIKGNIDYDQIIQGNRDKELIDSLVQVMLDVILTETPKSVKIGKETKNREIVKSVYMKLTSEHIQHIIEQYKAQRHKITHTTAYLRTMLYTCFQELEPHVTNAVRADGMVW